MIAEGALDPAAVETGLATHGYHYRCRPVADIRRYRSTAMPCRRLRTRTYFNHVRGAGGRGRAIAEKNGPKNIWTIKTSDVSIIA